jgi:hypothetical protein
MTPLNAAQHLEMVKRQKEEMDRFIHDELNLSETEMQTFKEIEEESKQSLKSFVTGQSVIDQVETAFRDRSEKMESLLGAERYRRFQALETRQREEVRVRLGVSRVPNRP